MRCLNDFVLVVRACFLSRGCRSHREVDLSKARLGKSWDPRASRRLAMSC